MKIILRSLWHEMGCHLSCVCNVVYMQLQTLLETQSLGKSLANFLSQVVIGPTALIAAPCAISVLLCHSNADNCQPWCAFEQDMLTVCSWTAPTSRQLS